MDALLKLSRGIDNAVDFLGRHLSWLVLLMVALGVYNTIARYIGGMVGANFTSNALIELQWFSFSILFFLGASYVLRHNEHVRVDVFYGNWPPKRKALVNLLGTLLFLLPFCAVVMWVSTRPVLIAWGWNPMNGTWRSWEMSPNPGGLPYAPIKSFILVGFGLLFIQGISEAIKSVGVLRGKVQSQEKTLEEQYAQGVLLKSQSAEGAAD
jgi:TRAP-type mannitol/chloroaromatic compound transport system permease small subunit